MRPIRRRDYGDSSRTVNNCHGRLLRRCGETFVCRFSQLHEASRSRPGRRARRVQVPSFSSFGALNLRIATTPPPSLPSSSSSSVLPSTRLKVAASSPILDPRCPQGHQQRVECFRVHPLDTALTRALLQPLDEKLRLLAVPADCEVNVRRPEYSNQGVRDWLDGGSRPTLRVGEEAAVTLKFVSLLGCRPRVWYVRPGTVHLPNSERVPTGRSSSARGRSDARSRRRDGVVDGQQVIVRVEGHLVLVERPFRCRRSRLQVSASANKSTRLEQGQSGTGRGPQELTPRRSHRESQAVFRCLSCAWTGNADTNAARGSPRALGGAN